MKIDQALRQAKKAAANGQLTVAREIYQQILTKFPKNAKARAGLADLGAANPPNPAAIQQLIGLFQARKLKEAAQFGTTLAQQHPNVAVIHNVLGATFAAMGQGARAEQAYGRAIKLDPKNAEIHANLARYYQGVQAHDQAVQSFQTALKYAPNNATLHYNIGLSYQILGHIGHAIGSYQKTLALNANLPEAWNNLGVVQQMDGDFESALESYHKSLKLRNNYAEAHNNLGTLYNLQDMHAPAKECFETAIQHNAKYAPAYTNLCELLEKLNQPQDMLGIVASAKQQFETLPADLRYFEALGIYRQKDFEQAQHLITDITVGQIAEQRKTSFLHLSAQIAHNLGQVDQAYDLFQQMNDAFANSAEFAQHDVDGLFQRIKRDADAASLLPAHTVQSHDDEPAPVFLIGFPRSGTTLLDTVLMGHSQITVVEEQNMVPQMEHAVLDKASIWEAEQLSEQDIARARDVYYDTLAQHVQDQGQVVIDKMPLNITKVPLIHRVFPNARYILALRHPMDSILSCWMQNFALNAAMGNMLQLPRIAEFYDYSMRIFDVATARYDLNVHRVRYEDLVLDLEGVARGAIDFLGLAWQDELLDYQSTAKARGRIHTPSYAQVVQPLYKSASDRWRAYEHHLMQERRRLSNWITAYGYDT